MVEMWGFVFLLGGDGKKGYVLNVGGFFNGAQLGTGFFFFWFGFYLGFMPWILGMMVGVIGWKV